MEDKKHLFFLVHGLFGKVSHMDSMKEALVRELPSNTCIVYTSKCNELLSTFEGVEMGALRIFEELIQVIVDNGVTHLSIVGYSMGGLYVRYLAGMLQRHPTFFREITPVNFVTFASPHLGATLWKKGLWTRFLNGTGRVLLGPSGFDLMSRGPNGVLDELCRPSSRYMQALARFPNLMLFCNARGDRSVRFWTSFLTDKHPFVKEPSRFMDLVFFKCEGTTYKPFMVDMENSKLRDRPLPMPERETVVSINFIWAVVPIFMFIMLIIAGYSWIKWLFYRPFLKWRCRRIARRFESRNTGNRTTVYSSSDSGTVKGPIENMEEIAHLAAEDLAPDDDSGSDSDMPAPSEVRGLPKPLCGPSALVDQSTPIFGFTENMRKRQRNLDALPWKKYVVLLKHYRSHANIIDRLHEDGTQGSELLSFFATQVIQ